MKRAPVISFMVLLAIMLVSTLVFASCSSTPAPTSSAPAPTSAAPTSKAPAPTSAAPTSSAPAPSSSAPAPSTSAPAPTSSAPPSGQVVTIKLGYDTPPTTGLGVPAEFFAKEVTAQTQGRVKVQTYPAGSLVTMGTSLQALRTGVADAYVVSIGANLDSFPILNFTSLPGLSFYPDTAADIKAEVDTMRAIIAKYPSAQDEIKGLTLLWSDTYSTAVCMGKKQIHVPADMVGVKVGVDGLRQNTVNAIGGVPVFTIPPQMYQQIQTGVVDSVLVAWGAALDWQLQEQVKYVLDYSFGGSQLPVFMATTSFNKISAADQKIVMNVAAQAEAVNRDFVSKQIPEARQKWAAKGVPVYQPTDAEKKLWTDKYNIVWNEYISKNKAAGVSDIQSIFNDWKTAVETPRK